MKRIDPDVQAILQEELQEISIALLASPPAGSTVPLSALQDYSRRLNRLSAMVRPLQQPLLTEATEMALRNIQSWLRQGGGNARHAMWRLIIAWPLEMSRYLELHGSAKATAELTAFLTDSDWLTPIDAPAEAADPQEQEDDALAGLPAAISRSDLSLQIPPDVSQSLVVELLQELPDLTERLAHRIESWAENRSNADLLLEARRVAHTIKGAANVVGVRGVAVFTHLLEDVLDLPMPEGTDLPQLTVRGVACLQQMTDALLRRANTPAQAETVANELLAALRLARAPQPAPAPAAEPVEATTQAPIPEAPAASDDRSVTEPPAPGLRVSPALVDDLFRLAGESTVSLNKLREAMQQSRQLAQQLTRRASSAIDHGHLLFPDTDARPISYQPGEAHLRLQDLREAIADMMMLGETLQARFREVDELMTQQERLSEELRHGTRQCRMLPAGEIAARLRRAVREAARQAGKQVQLQINGAEALVDAHVLNALFEPLMHAIRNAIDHGIESNEVRRRSGKPPQGQLTVSFTHEGSDVVVRCADDGQGLDTARIRQRAIERRLIAENDNPPDDVLARLIFEPGFSTRDSASQTSGRGIGMSAIVAQVEAVKGIIEVHSEPGRGVRVEFRVPESLLSVGGLLVNLNGHTAGISSRGLQRVTMIDAHQLFAYADGHAVSIDGQTMPIHRLERLMFGDKFDAGFPETGQMPVLIIRAGETNALVMVESIVATRALLIRRPGVYLEGFPALFGTTTLSDGSIVAVLDLVELLRAPPGWTPLAPPTASPEAETSAPLAWVIDDSAAVRREIAAHCMAVGYGIRLSGSGEEAMQQLTLPAPALVIVDADMPGVNGVDVCRRMRGDGRFRTVPIVVLSARGEACRDAARAAGATLLLPKPCPRPILQRMLERYPVPPSNARIPYPSEESTTGERSES